MSHRASAISSWLLAGVLATLLAGCKSDLPSPPGVGEAPPGAAGSFGGGSGGSVTVARGDSVYALAHRHQVPMRDLIEANNLKPPYVLVPGRRLVLPSVRAYVVKPGETIQAIARQENRDPEELARANGLAQPYQLRTGQVLRLPQRGGETGPAEGTQGPGPAGPTGPAPGTPTAPPRGSVDSASLAPPGPPPAPPPGAPPPPPPPAAAPVAAAPGSRPNGLPPGVNALKPPPAAAERPATTERQTAERQTAERQTAERQTAERPAAAEPEAPPSRGNGRFLWPVKGKVMSGFGPKPDGMHNDGINIAAARGTSVMAADNGTVVYAGNELRGYGNLLLVRHEGGWITAYAHLDRILVRKGAAVKRGQKVGVVGSTGSVTEPQLHFEVRKGSQAVNPNGLLEPAPNAALPAEGGARPGPA